MKRLITAALITLVCTLSAPLAGMVSTVAHADSCNPSISIGVDMLQLTGSRRRLQRWRERRGDDHVGNRHL